jgi:hypothetical protein
MAYRHEAHIMSPTPGHHLTTDCWCEPVDIRWMKNLQGEKFLAIIHDDLLPPILPHYDVLEARDENPEDWITLFLNTIKENPHGTDDE